MHIFLLLCITVMRICRRKCLIVMKLQKNKIKYTRYLSANCIFLFCIILEWNVSWTCSALKHNGHLKHEERFNSDTFWRILSVFYTSLYFPRMFLFGFFYCFLPMLKAANQGVTEPSRSLKISTLRFYWFVLFFKESHLVWAFGSFLCTCACIFKVVAEFCITVLRCIPP